MDSRMTVEPAPTTTNTLHIDALRELVKHHIWLGEISYTWGKQTNHKMYFTFDRLTMEPSEAKQLITEYVVTHKDAINLRFFFDRAIELPFVLFDVNWKKAIAINDASQVPQHDI